MDSPSQAPDAASRHGRVPIFWLGLILALGTLLRLREARMTPLWFDEVFTLWLTREPFGTMLDRLAGDIHPPLFSALLWTWRAAGGESVLWLKTLPVAIGVLTVLALYFAVRDWFGPRAALLAAALLAIHPTHVYFSQELRSYSLLILLVLLVTWNAWRWVKWDRRRDAVAYVASAALALLTHYLAGLVLLLLGLWGYAQVRREARRVMEWTLWQSAVLLAFAPQAPTFLHQLRLSGEHWMPSPVFEDLANLARKITFGARYMVPILAAVAALPLIRTRTRRPATLVWWMMLAPVAAAYALTAGDTAHLFVERYMYFALPLFCALVAEGLVGAGTRWAGTLAGLALFAFATRSMVLHRPYAEAVALDRAVRDVESRLQPGDLVFCGDSHSLLVFEHRRPDVDARLLMTWSRLPYYEGASLIGDSLRATPDALAGAAATGRRWWGLRTRHGGISSAAGAALMDSLARGERRQVDMVTVWAGQAGM